LEDIAVRAATRKLQLDRALVYLFQPDALHLNATSITKR
jgi:hypothetical protein